MAPDSESTLNSEPETYFSIFFAAEISEIVFCIIEVANFDTFMFAIFAATDSTFLCSLALRASWSISERKTTVIGSFAEALAASNKNVIYN